MTTKKAKAAEEAGTLVYCGPTIPGVAKQFTFYRGRRHRAGLKAAQERRPVLRALNHTAGSATGGHEAAGNETWPHLRTVPRGAEAEITGGKANGNLSAWRVQPGTGHEPDHADPEQRRPSR